MPLINVCHARDCDTLTMGEFCLEHEQTVGRRAVARLKKLDSRARAPLFALVLAVAGAYLGRVSGHIGR
jgi:hypothetical protein